MVPGGLSMYLTGMLLEFLSTSSIHTAFVIFCTASFFLGVGVGGQPLCLGQFGGGLGL